MCFFSAPSAPAAQQPVVIEKSSPPPTPTTAGDPPSNSPPVEKVTNNNTETIIKESALPEEQDKAVQDAKNSLKRNRRKQSKANQTLVTGGDGLISTAATGNKQLFGA